LKVSLDTSFIVPLVAAPSRFHERTLACFEQFQKDGAEFVLAGHALLESFSVLTRSPEPFKVLPRHAERALRETFADATITGFARHAPWKAMEHTISRGHHGGRIYDTAIALAAFEAGARLLLTWNAKHFLSIAPAGLEIRVP